MKIEKIKEKLKKYENIPLSEININEVDEITDIRVNKKKSSNDRILDFLNTVKNPYVFKHNGKLVKIGFSDTEKTADECITNVLKNLYR